MKTTSVRKLQPEAWGKWQTMLVFYNDFFSQPLLPISRGFLCPVHTPDGAPCGLLNHLARGCLPTADAPSDVKNLLDQLFLLGVGDVSTPPHHTALDVMVDGKLVGFISREHAAVLVENLRVGFWWKGLFGCF